MHVRFSDDSLPVVELSLVVNYIQAADSNTTFHYDWNQWSPIVFRLKSKVNLHPQDEELGGVDFLYTPYSWLRWFTVFLQPGKNLLRPVRIPFVKIAICIVYVHQLDSGILSKVKQSRICSHDSRKLEQDSVKLNYSEIQILRTSKRNEKIDLTNQVVGEINLL